MARNKYLDKYGVYRMLESLEMEDLTKDIEDHVDHTRRRRIDMHGGEAEAADAYHMVLEGLPKGTARMAVDMVSYEIDVDRKYHGRNDTGTHAREMAECIINAYGIMKALVPENELEKEMKNAFTIVRFFAPEHCVYEKVKVVMGEAGARYLIGAGSAPK